MHNFINDFKHYSRTKFISHLFFCFFLFFAVWGNAQSNTSITDIEQDGLLDLRNWDFSSEYPINIKGKWAFYPNTFVDPKNPPDPTKAQEFKNIENFSPEKYGSYVLKVQLPSTLNSEKEQLFSAFTYGMQINKTITTYELYINEKLFAHSGYVTEDKKDSSSKKVFADKSFFFSTNKEITICLLFAHKDKIFKQLSPKILQHDKDLATAFTMILGSTKQTLAKQKLLFQSLILAITLITSFYYLLDFLLQRTKIEKLFFSLNTLAYAIDQPFVQIFALPLSWQSQYRLDYSGDYIMLIFTFHFANTIFKEEFSGKIFRTIHGGLMLCGLLCFILPMQQLLTISQWTPLFYVIGLFYALVMCLVAFFKKRAYSSILLTGFSMPTIVAIILIINLEMLNAKYTKLHYFTDEIIGIAFVFWILSFALIIILRQIDIEKKTTALSIANNRLQNENIRMESELEVTRRIQDMLLPKHEELNVFPHVDIGTTMIPASEVGGDYYDVLLHDKEHNFTIGIGDITGHGLESGMLMLMTQMGVRTLLEAGMTEPKKLTSALNKSLHRNVERMQTNKSLTFGLLEYDYQEDSKKGNIVYCGQHETLIVIRKDGTVEEIDTMDLGFPLALENNIEQWLNTLEITLNSDDGVVLYTDGITEAENKQKELYGMERFIACLKNNWQLNSAAIVKSVLDEIKLFVKAEKLYDDVTLVVLKQC